MISVIIIIYFIITCACICVCKEITSWPGSVRDGDAPENLDSFLSQVFHSDTIIFLSSTQQLTNVHGVRTVAVANQTRVELSSRAVFLWCDTRPEEVVRQFGGRCFVIGTGQSAVLIIFWFVISLDLIQQVISE